MPPLARTEPHADVARVCGAKLRRGGTCTQRAGHRTDHPGQGKCWLHGGATPIKHGRYSTITRPRIRELLAEHAGAPDPSDTQPEVALMRALTHDYVERYDATMDALEAWHESWRTRNEAISDPQARALLRVLDEFEEMTEGGDGLTDRQRDDLTAARDGVKGLRDGPEAAPGKPTQLPDVADAVRLLAEVTKAVERIEKLRAANAITYDQLKRFLFGVDRVLEARILDAALLAKIRDDVLAVAL